MLLSHIGGCVVRCGIPRGRCSFWDVGVKGRSCYSHRHLPVSSRPYKRPTVSNEEKMQVHIPQWCTPSFLPHTHPHTPHACVITPHLVEGGRQEGGRKEILFHCDNTLLSLPRDWLRKVETWDSEWAMSFHSRQRHQTIWHAIFIAPLQMFLSCMSALVVGVWYRGRSHEDHPSARRSTFTPWFSFSTLLSKTAEMGLIKFLTWCSLCHIK